MNFCHSLILMGALTILPSMGYSNDGWILLEDFEAYETGETPKKDWKARNGDPKGIYSVAKEEQSGKYLQAIDQGKSVQFFRKVDWSLKEYPFLRWLWRVGSFPSGSDERLGSKNDSACAVYVVFPKRWLIPESIKYIWSEVVPKGTKIVRKDRFPMIVIETGASTKNEWNQVVRNVKEDYEEHFGRSAPNPVAIGFLTDANAVGGKAEGHYDDFYALSSAEISIEKGKGGASSKAVP